MQIAFEPNFFSKPETLKFFSNGLLIDTGPLYLLLIGRCAPKQLSKFGYSKEEYDYLVRFLGGLNVKKLVITPHIFHEFYKHIQKLFQDYGPIFDEMNDMLLKIQERHVEKDRLLTSKYFKSLEIGEHSLYLAYQESPSAILTDEPRGKFCGILRDDNDTLVLDFKKHVIPYLMNMM